MLDDKLIQRALALIDEGRNDHARVLIKQAIDSNPKNVQAWSLLVQVSESKEERVNAARKVLRLKPDDEMAQKYVVSMIDQEALRRVVDLMNLDRKEQANFLLSQLLGRNPDIPDAWTLKARLAENRAEKIEALEQVLRLKPEDEQAAQYLTRLRSKQTQSGQVPDRVADISEDKEERDKRYIEIFGRQFSLGVVIGTVGAILFLSLACIVVTVPMLFGGLTASSAASGETSCEDLIALALQVSDEGCQTIGSNQVCYGNENITANVSQNYVGRFNIVGDTIPIEGLEVLSASPLDMVNNFWGVAVMKLKANIQGTVLGQNVTFMVFGDTEVDNDSGDMSTFYFSTGFSGITCREVPFDGLLIEMDEGVGIIFRANGVDFLLEGDAVLKANPGEEMTVSMISGSGKVYANGQMEEFSQGTFITVSMDENLNPIGPPSQAKSLSDSEIAIGCLLLDVGCQEGTLVAAATKPIWTPTRTTLGPIQHVTDSGTNDPSKPTNTPVPVKSGQPTNTSVPLPTNTAKPLPPNSSLPLGPSNTPPPGSTATFTPPPGSTNTPPPPATATNPPAVSCSSISLSPGSNGWSYRVTNNNASPIILTQINLTWPDGVNGAWRQAKFNGKNIVNGNYPTSPATGSVGANVDWRTIPGGTTWDLVLEFANDPADTPYTLEVSFDVGCSKSRSQ